ncbi:MAG TPA: hypothetical protein VHB20_05505 [Verrucomicrobiae bacterium]|nr:hypothetical protein [Verrucomicrobiae bacterium]
MKLAAASENFSPDPAAIFAAAFSLWTASWERASRERADLSRSYHGVDQFMREIMRIATQFETWACRHLNFENLGESWPYLLQSEFGAACLDGMAFHAFAAIDESHFLRVALRLNLPLRHD